MRLGLALRLSRLRGLSISSNARSAPTLVLASNTTYPPPLSVLISADAVENDVLRVQSSATFNFASPIIDDTSVLDAAAIAGGSVSVTGLSSITSPAQTYFRASVNGGAWSNIVKHGDTVAPTITSSAAPTAVENTLVDAAFRSGTLTANDDIQTWTIIGGADAAKFSIAGNTWSLTELADFETKTSYAVLIQATDYGGNTATQTMTLSITDIDELPNAFAFTDVTAGALSTQFTSNTITIAGLAVSVPVTVTGGTYSKNGGAFTSAAGTATNGDTFAVRQTSASANSTTVNVTLNVGTGGDTFSITTEPSATLPTFVATANPAKQNVAFASSSVTFAAQPIGAASATRNVIVFVDYNLGGNPLGGVTIGGITATSRSNLTDGTAIFTAVVPTGTTADIVVSATNTFQHLGIQVIALYDANTTPTEVVTLPFAFNNSPHSVTVTTPANGFTFLQFRYEGATTVPVWTGATAEFSRGFLQGAVDTVTSLASTNTSGVKSVGNVGNRNSTMKSVSFQP